MALSESGLIGANVYPGPMIYGPKGHRVTVRPKKGAAPAGKVRASKGTTSYYVRPKASRRGR